MKSYETKDLIKQNIILLIPLIIYGIYKNGILVFQKDLIDFYSVFKLLYMIIIALLVKFGIDLIKHHRLVFDYNVLYVILVAMMMPTNINLLYYTVTFILVYFVTVFLDNKIKYNKVCFIYLVILLGSLVFSEINFQNALETKYAFNYSFMDYFLGKGVGGIGTTSILFTAFAFLILCLNYYYKKNIPIAINLVYFGGMFIYFLITGNSEYLLNSEVLFGSVFVSALPLYSPYTEQKQIIYGVLIGIITLIVCLTFNYTISIYVAIFIVSLLSNVRKSRVKVIA